LFGLSRETERLVAQIPTQKQIFLGGHPLYGLSNRQGFLWSFCAADTLFQFVSRDSSIGFVRAVVSMASEGENRGIDQ